MSDTLRAHKRNATPSHTTTDTSNTLTRTQDESPDEKKARKQRKKDAEAAAEAEARVAATAKEDTFEPLWFEPGNPEGVVAAAAVKDGEAFKRRAMSALVTDKDPAQVLRGRESERSCLEKKARERDAMSCEA